MIVVHHAELLETGWLENLLKTKHDRCPCVSREPVGTKIDRCRYETGRFGWQRQQEFNWHQFDKGKDISNPVSVSLLELELFGISDFGTPYLERKTEFVEIKNKKGEDMRFEPTT